MRYLTFDIESNGSFDRVSDEFDSFIEAQAHLMQMVSEKIKTEAEKLEAVDKTGQLTTDYHDGWYTAGSLSDLIMAYEQVVAWEPDTPTNDDYWQIESDDAQYGIEKAEGQN